MTEHHEEPEIATAIRAHFRRLHAFIKSELSALQEAGAIRRDETVATLAWLLVDVAVGFGMVTPLGLRGRPAKGTAASAQRLVAALLRQDSA